MMSNQENVFSYKFDIGDEVFRNSVGSKHSEFHKYIVKERTRQDGANVYKVKMQGYPIKKNYYSEKDLSREMRVTGKKKKTPRTPKI